MQVYRILIWCVGLAAIPGYCVLSEPPPETPAEAITKDVQELSEQVDEVAEEGESEEADLDTKAAHEKRQEKFEKLYQNALQNGLEEAKKEYKEFEHGAVEGLDLVGLASEHLKQFWYIGQCRRNYSLPCPSEWSWDDSEKVCTAPADYDGPCEKRKSFDDMDSKAREDYAWRCHASWPCMNDTPIDDSKLCPLEWTKVASTVCIAPTSYDGVCSPIASFQGLSVLEKLKLEHLCSIRWPRLTPEYANQADIGATEGYAAAGSSSWPSGTIDETGAMVPLDS